MMNEWFVSRVSLSNINQTFETMITKVIKQILYNKQNLFIFYFLFILL